jgi:hypothetical protein
MQRTTLQSCRPPGLLGNVLVAGERRSVAQLHWPRTRTVPTVAGPSLVGGREDERRARRLEASTDSLSQGKLTATLLALPHRFGHLLEEKIREKPPVDHNRVSKPTVVSGVPSIAWTVRLCRLFLDPKLQFKFDWTHVADRRV